MYKATTQLPFPFATLPSIRYYPLDQAGLLLTSFEQKYIC